MPSSRSAGALTTSSASTRSSRPTTSRGCPFSLKVLLENLLRNEDGVGRAPRGHRGARHLGRQGRALQGDRVHARARDPPGLHRRPVRRRPRGAARRDGRHGRRPRGDQPARPGRARHRPLRAGRRVRLGAGLPDQRREGVRAQRRALRVPALGADGVRGLQGRAAGHGHRPPGQPRVPRARRVRERGRAVPGHARRDRLAHDDDQRPRRARLGRRRHRGGGRDARPADVDADPARRRLQAGRRAARGRDRDRPRAHRHRAAARARRRRAVRRVLRAGHRQPAARRPRDDRQHVAGVRLDVRDLPDRRRDAPLPRVLRPPGRAGRARRDVRPRAGPVARRGQRGADVLGDARARPRRGRPVARRAQAPAGPRLADRGQGVVPAGARGHGRPAAHRGRRAVGGVVPRLGPAGHQRRLRARPPARARGLRDGRRPGRRARRRPPCRSRSATAPRPSSTTGTS